MSENPVKVAVIVGSTRTGRFGPTVSAWFVEHARRRGDVTLDLIDLAEDRLSEHVSGTSISARLAAADGFVVVTPEYNHSYPAPLKSAIDSHYTEWQAKPIGFVSYGGVSGGLRAVEHLRHVFAELHAVTVRDTVSFHGAAQLFDATGNPTDPAAPAAAADQLLDQLHWWASALRTARTQNPYAA
ncbi:NAD(P)H-dependent FMN reductase [Nocardia tenerifensis]|uniref:NAD(P)H-dependent FMN reductase n=1 Tax=Nocardia tenerifensis TaxID=228006 RepID=A0A318KK61_9NOCA|nr:NAD(P)H-dependent oxidoreductase [Nocardia tenerifensis]PXX68777.1 NAD(P)H-dependent FMN reductase [Nocardia tenerifensis]